MEPQQIPLYIGQSPLPHVQRVTTALEKISEDVWQGRSWETSHRLPRAVLPVHYDLHLDPRMELNFFNGKVTIDIDINEPRNFIHLHMKGLNILSSQLFLENGMSVPLIDAFPFRRHEFWVILTEETLVPGAYILRFDFNGDLASSVVGMFSQRVQSALPGARSEESLIVISHLEPQYARRVFPCFDEPSFKATFSIRLVRPVGFTALSNMPEVSSTETCPREGNITVTFAKTPPMSTYLLAFIVTDFEPTQEIITAGGVPIRVFSQNPEAPDVLNTVRIAKETMDWYESYFKIGFPLPKLDILAVPEFASGAMENWGMIIIREMKMSTEVDSIDWETINYTIAHEMANQWFGNLASILWWDDIWLKEGMATFLANLLLDDIYPEMEGIPNFIDAQLHRGLISDATLCTRSINQEVIWPCDIADVFDAITYTKAAAVLRMFESTNPDKFRRGLQCYYDIYKYSNGTSLNLWQGLDTSVEAEDWVHAISTWTNQPGYPLVLAARGSCSIAVQQIRCLNDIALRFDTQESPYQFRWDVPIQYITSVNPCEPEVLFLTSEEKEARADLPPGVCWFKMNIRQHGFYRVTYHQQEWMNLRDVLLNQPEILTPEDRANLLDDAFFLAQAGFVCYGIPLQLIHYLGLGLETHWLPWAVFSRHLSFLRNALHSGGKKTRCDLLFSYMNMIVENQFADSLWEISSDMPIKDRRYKLTLLKVACKLGYTPFLEEAKRRFLEWKDTPENKPHPDLRRIIYKYGMDCPNMPDTWGLLWDSYINEKDTLEKCILLEAMATVRDPELCQLLLDHLKNDNKPDDQDLFLVLFTMANNPVGNEMVWKFLKENWDLLLDKYYLSDTCLGLVLPHVTQFFFSEEKLREMEAFLKTDKNIPSAICALDCIQHNLNWDRKYRRILLGWMELLIKGKVC